MWRGDGSSLGSRPASEPFICVTYSSDEGGRYLGKTGIRIVLINIFS